MKDTQCGFKLFKGDMAREVFNRSQVDSFGYDAEVLWQIKRAGFEIVEVGVAWQHDSDSRVRVLKHSWRILRDTWRIRKQG